MSCRSGCRTQDHRSWGECARAANLKIGNAVIQADIRKTDTELHEYREARKLGIQPKGTQLHQVRDAVQRAERSGRASGHTDIGLEVCHDVFGTTPGGVE